MRPPEVESDTLDLLIWLIGQAINLNRGLLEEVHPPVVPAAEQRTTNDISQARRNDALPDIQANSDARSMLPNPQRDEKHICDNVIEAQAHESKDGPPDAQNLAGKILALHTEETSQADEPVAADAAKEDHVEVGRELLLRNERLHFGLVGVGIESPTVTEDESDDEE